jgi:hypothetical protein
MRRQKRRRTAPIAPAQQAGDASVLPDQAQKTPRSLTPNIVH